MPLGASHANQMSTNNLNAYREAGPSRRLDLLSSMSHTSSKQQSASDQSWWLLDLPENCIERVVELLPANEVACVWRLVTKDAARKLDQSVYISVNIKTYSPRFDFAPSIAPSHAVEVRWGAPGAARSLTLKQRKGLLCCMARSGGEYAAVSSFAKALDCKVGVEVLTAAAGGGHVGLCTQLLEELDPILKKDRRNSRVVAAAAAGGHLEVVQLLAGAGLGVNRSEVGCPPTDPMACAAIGRHLHVCDWLAGKGGWKPKGAVSAFNAAAEQGQWEAATYIRSLVKDRRARFTPSLVYVAHGCSLEALKAMCTEEARIVSGDGGLGGSGGGQSGLVSEGQQQQQQQEVEGRARVQQLREHDQGLLLAFAAASPTPDWQAKVQWVLEQGVAPVLCNIFHVEVLWSRCSDIPSRLEWLEKRGIEFDWCWLFGLMKDYATAKHLSFFKELLSEGWEMDASGVAHLAKRGQLELLRAVAAAATDEAGDARIRRNAAQYAARRGHLHVVRWALGQEQEGAQATGVEATSTLEGSNSGSRDGGGGGGGGCGSSGDGGQSGKLEAFLRLSPACSGVAVREATLWIRGTVSWALESGNSELVRWLRAQGCEWPHGALATAAAHCSEELVEWMVTEGGCPAEVSEMCRYERVGVTGWPRCDTCAVVTGVECRYLQLPQRQGRLVKWVRRFHASLARGYPFFATVHHAIALIANACRLHHAICLLACPVLLRRSTGLSVHATPVPHRPGRSTALPTTQRSCPTTRP